MRNTVRAFAPAVFLLALSAAGCGGSDGFRPINPGAAVFWDRQTTETAALLHTIADEFNAAYPGLPIKVEQAGGYTQIFRKVTASIQARVLPSMAVSYPTMTMQYIRAGAVLPLDDFIQSPETGFSKDELEDFFPAVLRNNVFASFGGKMYSFPFATSVLMMYFNRRLLAEAGIDAPPETWDAFLEQCRQIKAKTGNYAYAVDVDCSTFVGMVYSMGGEVYSDGESRFDSPETIRALTLYETLVREGLAYQISAPFDDQIALSKGKAAFFFRSSSGRTHVARLMEARMDEWGMARIPQADPAQPVTVLYGPSICLFNTTSDQAQAAWAFVKHFTSPETVVRWAVGTGYLPARKSAANHPDMRAFWGEWKYNRAAFDCLPFARPEPNAPGWQAVRGLVEESLTEVLNGTKPPPQAALELKRAADEVLAAH